jgi:hypothetical protein
MVVCNLAHIVGSHVECAGGLSSPMFWAMLHYRTLSATYICPSRNLLSKAIYLGSDVGVAAAISLPSVGWKVHTALEAQRRASAASLLQSRLSVLHSAWWHARSVERLVLQQARRFIQGGNLCNMWRATLGCVCSSPVHLVPFVSLLGKCFSVP